MKSRVAAGVLAVVVALGLVAVGLVGCSGAAPKPSPTPTPPFASADAAYKAAEATYRAYVDAGNHLDLAEPKTFQPLYSWLLGDALDHQRQQLTAMTARGLHMTGRDVVTLVSPMDGGEPVWGDVYLAVCVDVSKSRVTDAAGNSLVDKNRPDIQSLEVALSRDAATSTGMKITSITGRDGAPTCAR